MNAPSWQITCSRCNWANSGANARCAKCGQPLRRAPGMLVAGQSTSHTFAPKALAPANRVIRPGGFMPRLIAQIADLFILAIVFVPLYFLWQAQLAPTEVKPGVDMALQQLEQNAAFAAAVALISIFYFAGSWHILGASPGMLTMGLRVVDSHGSSPGFIQALSRYIFLLITGVVGWVPMITNKSKQGIHDAMARTYVVQYVDAETLALEEARLAAAQSRPVVEAAPDPVLAPPPPVVLAAPVAPVAHQPAPPASDPFAPPPMPTPPPLAPAPATYVAQPGPMPAAHAVEPYAVPFAPAIAPSPPSRVEPAPPQPEPLAPTEEPRAGWLAPPTEP